MSALKKILVPFADTKSSISALEYAALFATGTGAKITALHLADPKDYSDNRAFQREFVSMVTKRLQPKLNEIHRLYPEIRKIDLQIRGKDRSVHDHIIDFASKNDCDLIVMKSEGLFHVADWEVPFKNSQSYKVVLAAPCPVFTFTGITETPEVKNILLPLDLTDGSLYKVPLAMAFAKQFDATLHLISGSEHSDDHAELNQQMDEIFVELQSMDVQVVKSEIFDSTMAEAIERYTSECSIDLIMIMSRPGFKWSDLWISPTAKKLICLSETPVISVRTNKLLDIGI